MKQKKKVKKGERKIKKKEKKKKGRKKIQTMTSIFANDNQQGQGKKRGKEDQR